MKSTRILVLMAILMIASTSCKRKKGCTDATALNYDEEATVDCQCCEYDTTRKSFDGSLKLQFNLKNFLTSFDINDTVTDYRQRDFILEQVVMYLSDITLIDQFSNDVPLKDIALIEFDDPNNTYVTLDSILAGTYNGIKFGVGVDSALNSKGPADFPYAHPLGQENGAYHWGPKAYVFVRFAGKADLDTNGTYEKLYAYHVGTDSLYRKKEWATPIVIIKDQETVLDLNINFDKIWVNGTDTIDIVTEFSTHTNPGDPLAKKFTDQFFNALTE